MSHLIFESIDRVCDFGPERNHPQHIVALPDLDRDASDEELVTLRSKDYFEAFQDSGRLPNYSISSCGHLIHLSCHHEYSDDIQTRIRRSLLMTYPEVLHRQEYLCPFCRQISNCLIPVTFEGFQVQDRQLLQHSTVNNSLFSTLWHNGGRDYDEAVQQESNAFDNGKALDQKLLLKIWPDFTEAMNQQVTLLMNQVLQACHPTILPTLNEAQSIIQSGPSRDSWATDTFFLSNTLASSIASIEIAARCRSNLPSSGSSLPIFVGSISDQLIMLLQGYLSNIRAANRAMHPDFREIMKLLAIGIIYPQDSYIHNIVARSTKLELHKLYPGYSFFL